MSPGAPALELITVGDELLLGEIVDGNSAWLGKRLGAEGIRVSRRATVGDDDDAIRDAVREAIERTGTVICTGGLGPTRDDRTRAAVAGLFGRELRVDDGVLAHIRGLFARLGREMPERNRVQAEVPEGATVFPNARGTAPGLALEDGVGRLVILLPGVPWEMEGLVDEHVAPYLQSRWSRRSRPILHRRIRTTGIPESNLAERLEDLLDRLDPLTLAFLPSFGGVDLRLTSWGALDEEQVRHRFDETEAVLRERLIGYVYGTDADDLAGVVGTELTRRGRTLVVAESCTGGLIAKRLTDAPGSSAFFLAGAVTYADTVKELLVGVRRSTLTAHGAVSEETVREMAEGMRRTVPADYAIAVTGVAGPGGGSPEKPVGTVWICVAGAERSEARRLQLPGGRAEVRERSAQAALTLLWKLLSREPA